MERRLKILLVSEHFPPDVKGGGELSAELLARNLAWAGHEVHVLTSSTTTGDNSRQPGIVLHRTLTPRNPGTMRGNLRRMAVLPRQIRRHVRRLHAEHSFDVIHYLNVVSVLGSLPGIKNQFATINSHQPFCPKANLFYKEREPCTGCNPVKFARCMRHSDYLGKMKTPRWLLLNPLTLAALYGNYLRFRAALKNVKPIAVSGYVSEQLARIGFPDAPVVPNLTPEPKKLSTSSKGGGKVDIVFLGALEKIKGVDLLLEAYAHLNPAVRSKTRLRIVGEGSLRDELARSAPEGVKFVGQVAQAVAQKIIAGCDIVVLPSLWPEPLSRVLLEATSLGKPVVATDVGGNGDVVTGTEGGLLSSPESLAFSKCLEKLITDAKRRTALGSSGRKRHLRLFSTARILGMLESLYSGQEV